MEIINESNFDVGVLQAELPVLLYFWAVWCVPCKVLGPIVEEVAREYEGKLKVGKVDADGNNGLTSRYSIMSLPTLKIFKGGKLVGEMVGAMPKASIEAELKKHM